MSELAFPPGSGNLRQDVLTSPSLPQGYLPPTKNGAEPKRPSRPISITPLARLSATVPNTIVVNWSSEFGRVSMAEAGSLEKPVGSEEDLSIVPGWGNIFLFMCLSLNLLFLVLIEQRRGGGVCVQSRG